MSETSQTRNVRANVSGPIGEHQIFNSSGFDGSNMPEIRVKYDTLPIEKRIAGRYNCHVILGRDRTGIPTYYKNKASEDPTGRKQGYGVNGFNHCSSIDIVAGVGGIDPEFTKPGSDSTRPTGPNFVKDAARIYISQKTDIDTNFLIGTPEPHPEKVPVFGRSGIGIKADHVRVIARKDIKLVTGTDSRNSLGEKIKRIGGIHLIAANDDREGQVQPLVKGNNLVRCLGFEEGVLKKLDELAGLVVNLTDIVMGLGSDVLQHTHNSPFFGLPTMIPTNGAGMKTITDAIELILKDITLFKTSLPLFEYDYLKPIGKKYINSALNKTN